MCGIWALFQKNTSCLSNDVFYKYFKNIQSRGPDRSLYFELNNPINIKLGFHRLSIMDTTTKGDQPFKFEENDRTVYLICNGEVYNHRELCQTHDLKPHSGSDCEVILLLYKKYGNMELISKELTGEYAFLICDVNTRTGDYKVYSCNDRFGVRPLFVLENKDYIMFSSELKGFPLKELCDYDVKRHPPRHISEFTKLKNEFSSIKYTKYYNLLLLKQTIFDLDEAKTKIRESFEMAVESMIESDREIGCLLSGGLDSSLVSSCASRVLKRCGRKLKTFSIGLPGSTDEKYANLVSEYIDSDHTHILVSEEDFLKVVPDVIRMIESYDITTVRASTGQYLISKWISENTNIKVLLGGDGSDELLNGYLYCHKAPSQEEMYKENVRILNDIHLYDGLRADRCIAGHGIEARFPFLNHKFVETVFSIDMKYRMPTEGLEKWLIRQAFNSGEYLPTDVISRVKCAFSDGCSDIKRSWYNILQENIENLYTDEDILIAQTKYKHLSPYTKESLYMRDIYSNIYGENAAKILEYYWLPKWCGDIKDPSARKLDFYKE